MISFIIPFRSNEPARVRSFKYVHDHLVREFPDDEVIIAEGSWEHESFNRSKARNFGAKVSHGDMFVFVDADSWVPREPLWQMAVAAGTEGWGFPYTVYYSLSQEGTDWVLAGMPEVDEFNWYDYVFPGPDPYDRPASVGGCIVVSRAVFEEVHGYDERFVGWGFEDRAFAIALETLCGPEIRIPGALYHLWHEEPEEERFAQPHIGNNRDLYARYGAAKGFPERMRALVGEH